MNNNNNKNNGTAAPRNCAHVLTFENQAERIKLICVKCGHKDYVKYFD